MKIIVNAVDLFASFKGQMVSGITAALQQEHGVKKMNTARSAGNIAGMMAKWPIWNGYIIYTTPGN